MSDTVALEALSRCKIRLRQQNPYFAVLTLFAIYQMDPAVDLADTDGRVVRLNAAAFLALPDAVATGLLLHVTLHAALLHPTRQSGRNPALWNIACDIIVNHIITTQTSFPVPPASFVAAHLSIAFVPSTAEQVYEYLLKNRMTADQLAGKLAEKGPTPRGAPPASDTDPSKQKDPQGAARVDQTRKSGLAAAMAGRFGRPAASAQPAPAQEPPAPEQTPASAPPSTPLRDIRPADRQASAQTMQHHWESALLKARDQEQQRQRQRGKGDSAWLKELEAACEPQISWRTMLSRFVIQTPTDFSGLDLRFVHAGLYLETLTQESVHIDVAIDTSGSIGAEELDQFTAELRGIMSSYPHIICHLYFCDTRLYGPYALTKEVRLPRVRGGGGTDFRPFFASLDEVRKERQVDAAIYFTDGEGDFPIRPPAYPVLWVALPGAIASEEFPFGQVIRMV